MLLHLSKSTTTKKKYMIEGKPMCTWVKLPRNAIFCGVNVVK